LVGARELAPPGLVREVEGPVVAALFPTDGCRQPAAHRRMPAGLVTESDPVRVGLHFFLRQTHHLTGLQPKAVEPEIARIDAVVAPLGVAIAQVEKLAGRASIAVEVDLESSLLGAG